VNKYREILHQQLSYHKVSDRCTALLAAADSNTWSPEHLALYEALDKTITEAMLFAESSCSRKVTKRFEWSPTLIESVEVIRFWRLLLKKSKGLPIHPFTIQLARTKACLPPATEFSNQSTIVTSLRSAVQTMKSLQRSHAELRDSYLNGLAEALVLERRPYLKKEENAAILHTLTIEQIQALIKREKKGECTVLSGKYSRSPLP
jgi:hypothetical protein